MTLEPESRTRAPADDNGHRSPPTPSSRIANSPSPPDPTPTIDHDGDGPSHSPDLRESTAPLFPTERSSTDARSHGERATVGPFELIAPIGSGPHSIVYRAREAASEQTATTQRDIALKVLRPPMMGPLWMRRFEIEAERLEHVTDARFARVLSSGIAETSDPPLPYLAIELVDGPALLELADRERWPTAMRVEMLAEAADAIHAAHQRRVVHHALHPANLRIDRQRDQHRLRILDVGMASLIGNELLMSSDARHADYRRYAAPERLGGRLADVDTRADVYSLAAMAWQLVALRPLYDFVHASPGTIVDRLRTTPPPRADVANPSVSTAIADAIDRGLAFDPNDRYRSAAEFADALRAALVPQHANAIRPRDTESTARDLDASAQATTSKRLIAEFLTRRWLAIGATIIVVLSIAAWLNQVGTKTRLASEQAENARAAFIDLVGDVANPTPARAVIARIDERFGDDESLRTDLLHRLACYRRALGDGDADVLFECFVERCAADDPRRASAMATMIEMAVDRGQSARAQRLSQQLAATPGGPDMAEQRRAARDAIDRVARECTSSAIGQGSITFQDSVSVDSAQKTATSTSPILNRWRVLADRDALRFGDRKLHARVDGWIGCLAVDAAHYDIARPLLERARASSDEQPLEFTVYWNALLLACGEYQRVVDGIDIPTLAVGAASGPASRLAAIKASALMELGRLTDAGTMFGLRANRALDLEPATADPDLLLARADWLFRVGRYADAERETRAVLDRSVAMRSAVRGARQLADILLARGYPIEARAYAERALSRFTRELGVDHHTVHPIALTLARIETQLGYYQAAQHHLEKLLDSTDPAVRGRRFVTDAELALANLFLERSEPGDTALARERVDALRSRVAAGEMSLARTAQFACRIASARLLAQDEPRAAFEELVDISDRIAQMLSRHHPWRVTVLTYAAEIAEGHGDVRSTRRALEAAAAIAADSLRQRHPVRQRVEAALARSRE